jgi:hypothetical protein
MTTYAEITAAPPEAQPQRDLMSRLPGLLRLLGTGVLIIAMYSFLAKGWQSGNDMFRYLIMLGHTGLLAAIGLASGHWLKEGKGARLLLALALASVPANFAILGAFIYSQTANLGAAIYPHYVAWSVDSLTSALSITAGALLVLIPVVWLGFMVLARSMWRQLAALFILSNAALLLPLRDPQLIALLVLAFAGINIAFSNTMSKQQIAARTQEGITALALQFLPLTILMVRSLWLYSMDLFLLNVMAASTFIIMRQASLYLLPDSRSRHIVDALSVAPAIVMTPLFSFALAETQMIADALLLPAGAMVSATMLYDISRRSPKYGGGYRSIAVIGLLLLMLTNLVWEESILAALACVVSGAVLLTVGFRHHYRNVFAGGFVLIAFGMADQLFALLEKFDLGSWATLAVLGVCAIVLASLIESQRGKIRANFERLKATYKDWDR